VAPAERGADGGVDAGQGKRIARWDVRHAGGVPAHTGVLFEEVVDAVEGAAVGGACDDEMVPGASQEIALVAQVGQSRLDAQRVRGLAQTEDHGACARAGERSRDGYFGVQDFGEVLLEFRGGLGVGRARARGKHDAQVRAARMRRARAEQAPACQQTGGQGGLL
jgi:hypothetical protein